MTGSNVALLKLLVVDDHVSYRAFLLRSLKDMGFIDIDQASSSQEATEKLQRKNDAGGSFYNILFLDLHMPGGSGWDLLRLCREDKNFDKVAIIIVSADGEKAVREKAAQAGATDYVVKPCPEGVIRACIDKTLLWLEPAR